MLTQINKTTSMTPEEKAKELVEKYFQTCHKSSDLELSWKVCKQCALIAVNEILDLGYTPGEKSSFNVYSFYSNVKIAIGKL